MREFEFRVNFLIQSILSLLWAGITFLSIEFMFNNTPSFAGWSRDKFILLLVIYYLSQSISKSIFVDNFSKLYNYINQGDLDFILLRPINSLFHISFRYFSFAQLPRIFLFFYLLLTYPYRVNINPSISDYILTGFLMILGIIGMYSIILIVNCYTFWRPQVWNIPFLGDRIREFAEYPSEIYKGVLEGIAYTLPIATFATIPTKFLLGEGNVLMFAYSVFMALFFFGLSIFVWKRGLLRYESAG